MHGKVYIHLLEVRSGKPCRSFSSRHRYLQDRMTPDRLQTANHACSLHPRDSKNSSFLCFACTASIASRPKALRRISGSEPRTDFDISSGCTVLDQRKQRLSRGFYPTKLRESVTEWALNWLKSRSLYGLKWFKVRIENNPGHMGASPAAASLCHA